MEIKKPKHIIIYADGACSGNPGPGGWAALVIVVGNTKAETSVLEIGGYVENTTNNKMELTAVGKALRHVEKLKTDLKVYTDSRYVVDGVNKWLKVWQTHAWKKSDGKPVANIMFWKQLDELIKARAPFGFEIHHVLGHSGDTANERCDEIAVSFSKRKPIKLFEGKLSHYTGVFSESLLKQL